MESLLNKVKEVLGVNSLRSIGGGGGCINSGTAYETPQGQKVFVKCNNKSEAKRMFIGEEASLKAISDTSTILVPKPIKVIDAAGSSALIMEYLDLRSLRNHAALGTQLARLHKDNWAILDGDESTRTPVKQFGFHVPTCCGYLPQSNEWRDDWVTFYCEKIDYQIELLKDGEATKLWKALRPKVETFFQGIVIRPSLLHGDLWSGNAAETPTGVAVFDAASFYGHHEYDLGIASMFGGFGRDFYNSYFKEIPKQSGFDNRLQLYELFHHLNHWNHFGGGYRSGSLRIMKNLIH